MPDDAAAGYQAMTAALATLGELAAAAQDGGLARVLAGDEVVLARMRAAAAALGGPGAHPDLADLTAGDDGGLLEAALRWHRYSRGPAPRLQQACAADVARGALRLWVRRREPRAGGAVGRRVRQRRARIVLLGLAGARCASLRAELRDGAAALTRRGIAGFPDHVARRLREVSAEVCDEVDWALPGPSAPDPFDPPEPVLPAAGDRLAVLFGVAFAFGAALTAGRLAAAVVPGATGAVAAVSVVGGAALAGWILASRRLLARRAALDRWAVEVTAGLRSSLERHIALRALGAEAAAAGERTGPGNRP